MLFFLDFKYYGLLCDLMIVWMKCFVGFLGFWFSCLVLIFGKLFWVVVELKMLLIGLDLGLRKLVEVSVEK